MIAVDTQVLVYAHRKDAELHAGAAAAMRRIAEGRALWAIPWPCAHEFLAIVTHPRIYDPPTEVDKALDQLAAWAESPSVTFLGETDEHARVLAQQMTKASARGGRVHDARVAAICIAHGIDALWSVDRDFTRFPDLEVVNPLGGRVA